VDGQGAPDAEGCVRCLGTGAFDAPESAATASIALGAINTFGGQPWPVAEHTIVLLAYVVVLGSPLTHSCLIVFIGLTERAILVRLHHEVASSGTRCLCCKPMVLVTLGGCHLQDGLVSCGSIEACKKIVRGSGEAL
jgi:hypothetical protein